MPTVDDRIIGQIGRRRGGCTTARDVENALIWVLGDRVHQTVTANLRHLVEHRVVVMLEQKRRVEGYWRHLYVLPRHYDPSRHGRRNPIRHRPLRPPSARYLAEVLRSIAAGGPRSLHLRILRLLRRHRRGLTSHEVRQWLRLRHQTASARLVELRQAGLVTVRGRRIVGRHRPSSIYFFRKAL